jgi:hypothetical protein
MLQHNTTKRLSHRTRARRFIPYYQHNVAPRGRNARRGHRQDVENRMLRERGEAVDQLSVNPDATYYMGDQARFAISTDDALRQQRFRQLNEYDAKVEALAERNLTRETARWAEMEGHRAADEQYIENVRRAGTKNRNNAGSRPYNSITLAYDASDAGRDLCFKDDMVKYRAKVREGELYRQGHAAFNPITGAPQAFQPPSRPQPPTQPH